MARGKSAVNEFLYDVGRLVTTRNGHRLIEGEGGGIREAQDVLPEAGLPAPLFIDTGVSFTAIIYRHRAENSRPPIRQADSAVPASVASASANAAAVGLPESTLRYYEQIGVFGPVRRDPVNGYRVYSQDDLDVLDAVTCLSGLGMPVADLREYLANATPGRAGAATQLDLMRAQRDRLAQEAEALELRRGHAELKVSYWEAVAAGDDVEVERIAAEASLLSQAIRPGGRRAADR
jgi:DNA-binding transcriptional MerR regulator